MAYQRYPPDKIVFTILRDYLRFGDLIHVGQTDATPRNITTDSIISDMREKFYVRLDAIDQRKNPGCRVIFLILSSDGKYTHHSPDLRQLLASVSPASVTPASDTLTVDKKKQKPGSISEIIILGEDELFSKKNLIDVITKEFQALNNGINYLMYHYSVFLCFIPDHVSVSPHKLLTSAEIDKALNGMLREDLPVILVNDPVIIWLRGVKGDIVEITRDSQTGVLQSLYYRRVV